MVRLQPDSIRKEFGEGTDEHVVALDDLDIDVEDGEFLIPLRAGNLLLFPAVANRDRFRTKVF